MYKGIEEFKKLPIDEIRTDEYNPRKISDTQFAKLKKNIGEDFGFLDPLILNSNPKRKNILISGHQRLKAIKELGFTEVMVGYVNLTLEKEKALNIAMNRISGEWDEELLVQLLNTIKDDLDKTGFEMNEITRMLDKLLEGDAEDDFVVEVPKNPKSKNGEIYQLGRHRLMCGDSTSKTDVAKLMNGNKAIMVFTDPPYNVDYTGGMGTHEQNKREGIMNDKMSKSAFYQFLKGAVENMIDNCDGGIYICMSSTELDTLKMAFVESGGHFQSFLIWVKNTFTLSRSDWQNQYEPILYGWKDGIVNHYFVGHRDEGNVWQNLEQMKPKVTEDGKMEINIGEVHIVLDQVVTGQVCIKKEKTDIWREKKPTKSDLHPTMKPIKLVQKALKASSKRNDIVLDLFGGSGSTIIACEKSERIGYSMELDPQYVDVIINRWELLTGQKAKKL